MDQDTNNAQPAGDSSQAAEAAPVATASDNDGVGENKLFAIVGYILPFLFFIPLLQESSKNNAYAKFHANQQLILLILWIIVQFVVSNVLFGIIGWSTYSLMSILNLCLLVLVIMGVINAAQGQMKELPLVGKFRILK
jgi:uncharacterized membrane protein